MSIFVRAFRHVATRLRVPRVLVTPHLMGRTMGPVGDDERQRTVLETGLELLETAEEPTIHDLAP